MKKIVVHRKLCGDYLLSKIPIHYYSGEYQWQRKQVEELIEDLTEEIL